jgi:hypothetical protein
MRSILPCDAIRSFERRRRRQLHVEEEIAVILLGQEARRQTTAERRIRRGECEQQRDRHDRLADEDVAERHVGTRGAVEPAVEHAESARSDPACQPTRFQQQR